MRGGRLRNLLVVQRNGSGRVVRLRAEGFSPPEISGTDFRMAIGRVGGWQLVKSTAFDVDRTGSGYRFRGRRLRPWRGSVRGRCRHQGGAG